MENLLSTSELDGIKGDTVILKKREEIKLKVIVAIFWGSSTPINGENKGECSPWEKEQVR